MEYSTSLIRILSRTITLQQATKLYTPYAPCTEYLLHLASIYVTGREIFHTWSICVPLRADLPRTGTLGYVSCTIRPGDQHFLVGWHVEVQKILHHMIDSICFPMELVFCSPWMADFNGNCRFNLEYMIHGSYGYVYLHDILNLNQLYPDLWDRHIWFTYQWSFLIPLYNRW